MSKELALQIKNIVFDNEQRNKDLIDYDELLKEIEVAINYTRCCESDSEQLCEHPFNKITHIKDRDYSCECGHTFKY